MGWTTVKKFYILLWKNLIIKKRHWFMSILEVLIPTVLFMAIVALRAEGGEELNPVQINETIYENQIYPIYFCEALASIANNGSLLDSELIFYPDNSDTREVMELIEKSFGVLTEVCVLASGMIGIHLENVGTFSVVGVNDSSLIEVITNENSYDQDPTKPAVFGGVVFNTLKMSEPPYDLNYTVRLGAQYGQEYTEFLFYPYTFSGPQGNGVPYQVFAAFQTLLDLAFTQLVTNQPLLVTTEIDAIEDLLDLSWIITEQNMPYPAYLSNNLAIILNFVLPMFLVLSFSFIVPPLLKRIVYEKETGVKELMKMMGLPSWMHWIAWFINCIGTSTISIIIMVLLISLEFKSGTGSVLAYTDPLIIFIFFFLYASALISFLFIISTFFDGPNIALALGVLVHILTFVIPNSQINQTADGSENYSFYEKMGMALIPNINLLWGIKMLMAFEGKGNGVQWSNLFRRARPEDPLTMGYVWIMFIVDVIVYSLIIAYIDNIAPGKYGVAQKWYFPFSPSYWRGTTSKVEVMADETKEEKDMFEEEDNSRAVGVKVNGLRKEFKKFRGETVKAVNGVSFTAYHGEITALLGHNGAGKTTTMSVLTGMYSPTSGSAVINGHDINGGMNKVRESLGLCPQHNMLFEDLTVREHLLFFGMLKGMSSSESKSEADDTIKMLSLDPKRNVVVTSLSGGMKRKVNLGIALIGGSKVVMLDEPTSGMDPEARRGMWDLLTSLKHDRTILLTTHFMEEADVLGDRIAIMAKGKVQCYGTPFFLKNRFGSGYSLQLSKEGDFNQRERCIEIVNKHIPDSGQPSESDEQLIFLLPPQHSQKFPDMFLELESAKTDLGIDNFGLSLTTMDDVFVKIGELTEGNTNEEEEEDKEIDDEVFDEMYNSKSTSNIMEGQLTGLRMMWSQLVGLITKRMIYSWRRKFLYSVMMIIPIGMAVFTVLSLNPYTGSEEEHRIRHLDLESYEDPLTFIGSDGSSISNNLSNKYNESVHVGSVVSTDNLVQTILNMSEGNINLAEYQDRYIIAADFKSIDELKIGTMTIPVKMTQVTSMYNAGPVHARPLAHNYLSNSLLNYFLSNSGESAGEKGSITVSTHPLPQPKSEDFSSIAAGGISLLTYGFGTTIPLGLAILVASFLIFPLVERATNAKQVQIMTGLHPGLFWLSNVIWDLAMYIVPAVIMFGLILLLDVNKTFLTNGAVGAVFLIIFLLGFFGTPFSYVCSFLAESAASGFALLIIVNILAGVIAPTGVFILRDFGSQFDSHTLVVVSDVVRWIFNWFPIFPFTRALMAITTVQEANNLCETGIERETLQFICKKYTEVPQFIVSSPQYVQCCLLDLVEPQYAICGQNITVGGETIIDGASIPCHTIESFYTWDTLRGINIDIIMLVIDGIIFFGLLVLIETKLINVIWSKVKGILPGYFKLDEPRDEGLLDSDVLQEQQRVNLPQNEDILRVFGLQKKFRRLEAVKQLSFGVKPGECFGLLGINGAGKTTTFRMTTGDEIPTAGSAAILGTSLNSSRRKFLSQIGYCPQFDSIIPQLTGKELLTLMCRVRGVDPNFIPREVQKWTTFLGIEEYINRESGSYSGGNKRKLNVAMSLVGDPPLILLDEPSTGVDPVARRNLWKIIKRIQRNGQSVVLTSHSMEECEALCDRLAIMVNGQFKCFGTNSHLKNKFAQGFTILVKLSSRGSEDRSEKMEEVRMNEVKNHVERNLENVVVKDEHKNYIHFHVGSPQTPWHRLFRVMEQAKQELDCGLEEYSVSQTTLEQVFLSFAKKQDSTDLGENSTKL